MSPRRGKGQIDGYHFSLRHYEEFNAERHWDGDMTIRTAACLSGNVRMGAAISSATGNQKLTASLGGWMGMLIG